MWRDLFRFSDLLDVPIAVMLFFFAVFAVVLFRALSPARAPHYETMSKLPLDDSTEVQR